MSHVVEVDQSGKIEDTRQDTILAFSDGITFSVLIPKAVKRDCVTVLRQAGLTGTTFYLRMFVRGLFFLLKNHLDKLDRIVIDIEYEGKERQVKENLINAFTKVGIIFDARQIQFKRIGKSSSAHYLAFSTLRKDQKPNLILNLTDLLGEFFSLKKSGTPKVRGRT